MGRFFSRQFFQVNAGTESPAVPSYKYDSGLGIVVDCLGRSVEVEGSLVIDGIQYFRSI
jgi:hypothetical protein